MGDLVAPNERRTERLLIRSWMPDDGAALSEAVSASYDHLRPWMNWATPNQSLEDSEELIRRMRARWVACEDFVLALFDPTETLVLGGSGYYLRGRDPADRVVEIGMWIRSDRARQGLGTHALRALIDWGFSDWPWRRLEWRCDTTSTASRRVAEKAGLWLERITERDERRVDGTLLDTAWYVVDRESARVVDPG
jgi:RimJ/RimL family protein N-acetyltransferase